MSVGGGNKKVTMGYTKQKEAEEKVFFTTYSNLCLLRTLIYVYYTLLLRI